MEPAFTAKIIDSLITTGPVAIILAVGVWWQTKGNLALVKQLNVERGERLNAMDQEIKQLRDRSESCERDRLELHKQMAILTAKH